MSLHPWWPLLVIALAAAAGFTVLWRTANADRTSSLRRIGIALVIGLCALRPTAGESEVDGGATRSDVVIMIDRTTSMGAEDFDGKKRRIEGVRSDVRAITKLFTGARFAVVTFDSSGRVEMPFTTDSTAVVTMSDVIDIQRSVYSHGSSIDAGLDTAVTLLKNNDKQFPNRSGFVFYLGDGEQTSSQAARSFSPIASMVKGGAVFGYGTTTGGRMRYSAESDDYINLDGNDALSKIDETNLKKIAGEAGLKYSHRSAPGADIPVNPDRRPASSAEARTTSGRELTWIVALVLIGLIGWELWDTATRARSTSRVLTGGKGRS